MSSSPFGFRRSTYALAAAAAFILTACSENATTSPSKAIAPGSASLDQSPEFNDPSGHGHVFHTKQWFVNNPSDNGKPGGGGAGGGNTGIFYHGGPVLQSGTKVVAIYWAAPAEQPIYSGGPTSGFDVTSGGTDGSNIGYFLSHLGASPYFNINSTYTDGSTNHILNSVSYAGYWVNNDASAPTGTESVSDAQMVAMLQSGFSTGALKYDPSTLYAIFTPWKVNLGGGFGTQYCAYHTHGTVNGNQTVLYAAMPYDAAYPSACTNGTAAPNGDIGADAEVNTLAHETEETTTDMLGTAWFDRRGYENADKCAWTWGSTYTTSNGGLANMNLNGKDFLVQQNWVNAGSGGCAKSYP
jgi:hypothetical protein